MTIQKIKENGIYVGYCNINKAYIYCINKTMHYAINGNGITRI